jgi:hypothetical protein
MPLITTEEQADAELRFICPVSVDPTLGAEDISYILAKSVVGTVWAADTAFAYGAVIIPTEANRNGHRYKCIMPGTSGVTEPSWPTWDNSAVGDGSVLQWQEDGAECDLWDRRALGWHGWNKKADNASCRFDFDVSGDGRKHSQVAEFCRKRAMMFAPVVIA